MQATRRSTPAELEGEGALDVESTQQDPPAIALLRQSAGLTGAKIGGQRGIDRERLGSTRKASACHQPETHPETVRAKVLSKVAFNELRSNLFQVQLRRLDTTSWDDADDLRRRRCPPPIPPKGWKGGSSQALHV